MRWVAHRERMKELKSSLGDDLFVISYESFANNTEKVIYELQKILGLHSPISIPDVKRDSLQKWKKQLSNEVVGQIQNIVGSPPDTVNYSAAPHGGR